MSTLAENPSWPSRLGRKWFQYRSFSPVPVLLFMLFLPQEFELSPASILLGLAMIVAGEGMRVWAVGYAGSATRTRGDKVSQLVHAGPYRFVRNPIYVGNILLYVGACYLFGFFWLSILALIYFMIQYSLIVSYEETILEAQMGEPYREYLTMVDRWIPSFRSLMDCSGHSFQLAAALRSERSTFLAILAITALWFLKRYAL